MPEAPRPKAAIFKELSNGCVRCDHCVFWAERDLGPNAEFRGGECRAEPPRVMMETRNQTVVTADGPRVVMVQEPIFVSPLTKGDFWCGKGEAYAPRN